MEPSSFRLGAPDGWPAPFGRFPVEDFGERISAYRKALGATQSEIAEITGVTRLTVIRWESGVSRPSDTALTKLVERMSEIYGWWVGEAAQAARPSAEELKQMGFKRPSSMYHFLEETVDGAVANSELWNAVSLFGGFVTAPRQEWASMFYLPDRLLRGVETAYRAGGEDHLWGFDIGHVIEASVNGTTYRAYLGPKSGNRRVTSADIAELRLVSEARYRLSHYDLVTRKQPLTEKELRQYADSTFTEVTNLRPRTYPQDLPREPTMGVVL